MRSPTVPCAYALFESRLEAHSASTSPLRSSALAGIRTFSPELEMETRIIGGQEAWAGSWPWQVALRYATMPACGGAVIRPSWVITAAHCFQG